MGSRVDLFLVVVFFLSNSWSEGGSAKGLRGRPGTNGFKRRLPSHGISTVSGQNDFRDRFRLLSYPCCRPGKLRNDTGWS